MEVDSQQPTISFPSSSSGSNSNSSNSDQYVETFFAEGSLGVTLRRRPEDGLVFIFEVVPNSQAVNLDVQAGDELWAVGQSEIGTTPLDKEAWNGLITFIKNSERPLRLVWRRRKAIESLSSSSSPTAATTSSSAAANAAAGSSTADAAVSPDVYELQKLTARFVTKEKDAYKRLFMVDPFTIAVEGRRIIKQGELLVEQKSNAGGNGFAGSINNLWTKTSNKRKIVLCNDLIIVAIPLSGNVFGVEYVLEITTCKVRSLGHVFGVHDDAPLSDSHSLYEYTFDIIFPGGELQFTSDSASSKEVWVLNIYLSLCESVDPTSKVLGWRHQYLLGTMHSSVIRRDEERVRELIQLCEEQKLDFVSIEAPDEDGFTPLHYACMFRLQNMVRILHEATADVTATDKFGFTPLHWAALQLDDASLSLMCTHVFDIDLTDNFGRTPLVLACIEGRDLSGKTDSVLVKRCLETMLTHKPNLHYCDSRGQTLLHYLAASWQFDGLESLLEAGCPDVNALDCRYFMSPLHAASAAKSVKYATGDGMRVMNGSSGVGQSSDSPLIVDTATEDLNRPFAAETMRTLLKFGAKPNLKDVQGRTPLMIILESEGWTKEDQEASISVVLSFGARVDDATNPVTNPANSVQSQLKLKFPELNTAAFQEKWNLLPVLDCDKLGIKLNHFEPLLDIDQSSNSASITSDKQRGASACLLCGFQFTLFRRQHHCRLCNLPTCDDCSKKRVIVEGAQTRACDCCYNRILTAQKKVIKEELVAASKQSFVQAPSKPSAIRTTSTAEKDKKESLFGSKLAPSQPQPAEATSKSMGRTMGVLNETHEQLQQRGEKLSQLSDRTGEMANQANEFARLAKQLNAQQKSRWF